MHGGVGVVADEHRQAGGLGEQRAQGDVGPAEVRRGEHVAVRADDAGRADTDAEDGLGREGHGVRDEGEHVGEDVGPGGPAGERPLAAVQHVAVEVEHGRAEHLVRGEVDADHLQPRAVDVDEGRRLAGTHGVGLAELHGLATLEEHRRRGPRRSPW